jgi:hypothetical protein
MDEKFLGINRAFAGKFFIPLWCSVLCAGCARGLCESEEEETRVTWRLPRVAPHMQFLAARPCHAMPLFAVPPPFFSLSLLEQHSTVAQSTTVTATVLVPGSQIFAPSNPPLSAYTFPTASSFLREKCFIHLLPPRSPLTD